MFVSKKLSLSFCAVSLALSSSFAQSIEITSSSDASLLSDTLIIPNSGVTVTSAVLSGGMNDVDFSAQAGTYTNRTGTYGLPSAGGVVFSTGDVSHYEDGPNNFPGGEGEGGGEDENSGPPPDNGNELECPSCFDQPNAQQVPENSASNAPTPSSTQVNSPLDNEAIEVSEPNPATDEQNALLTQITGQTEHFDPIELSITFDVDDSVSVISFVGAFGSEEFPEFVDTEFVDGFGMFLNGVNLASAEVTDGSTDGAPALININHPDFAPVEGTELNGMLAPNGIPILQFDIPVEPGSTGNTFTLLLADASDSALDTTIFLSSFGNFDAEGGESEFTPIMPDDTSDNGDFVFTLPEVDAGETIWIDPDVATGYTYTATDGGLFASVTAPTLLSVNDSDGYLLSYLVNGVEQVVALTSGQTFDFDVPVPEFTISSINVELALDPTDPLAFVTGVAFSEGGQFGVIQSPITQFVDDSVAVSAPGTVAIFALSLIGLCALRRKKF